MTILWSGAGFVTEKSMLGQLVIAFVILGICLFIHITGMVFAGDQLVRRREKIEQRAGPAKVSVLLITVFAFLMLLHMTEACLWAAYYYWRGFFESYETALYFSLKSYSTVGYGDVLLPQNWRLLGTIEGISGVLLCGLSTAFLFAVVNALFQVRMQQLSKSRIPVQTTAAAKRDGPEMSTTKPHEEAKIA